MNGDIKYPLYKDDLFVKAKRLDDYGKLRTQYKALSQLIEGLQGSLVHRNKPNSPREDLIQYHDDNTLRILLRQKSRLEEKISEVEKLIKQDIEQSKNEL